MGQEHVLRRRRKGIYGLSGAGSGRGGGVRLRERFILRHCEEPLRRSNPDCLCGRTLDCFATLAMTMWVQSGLRTKKQRKRPGLLPAFRGYETYLTAARRAWAGLPATT
ncbi:hypothetical protein FXV83_33200 [Bradyrhizobium hipponense]|uniref:Uncharacterized protein n=1 Tax=Bradyrhizobium hipponense TaxID=2605638 RepID=A0A5S4YE44_9BRAD|nr:hypothetical protein FXV83_33200 [Bradyrhizobium hipponense]